MRPVAAVCASDPLTSESRCALMWPTTVAFLFIIDCAPIEVCSVGALPYTVVRLDLDASCCIFNSRFQMQRPAGETTEAGGSSLRGSAATDMHRET